MKDLRKYVIPFAGLKEGRHEFEFEIEDEFFDQFESSEIKKGRLNVKVILVKHQGMMEMIFEMEGIVRTTCDRCLDEFELPVRYNGKLFFKTGNETRELTDEIIILSPSEHEVNVSQFMYEFIHLALPYRKIHPDINGVSGCNPGMIRKLDTLRTEEVRENITHPAWDKLKELTDQN